MSAILFPVCVCGAAGVDRTPEGEASDENDDGEFFDAVEESPAFITVTASNHTQHR